jgi:2-oxo-3-hexenedioate decarboxylase
VAAFAIQNQNVDVTRAAAELFAAEADRRDRQPLTDKWPDLDLETAYHIQEGLVGLKLDRGESIVGAKLGLTSRAKQQQMGVTSPITAWLTDAMSLPTDMPLHTGELIHPRVEPEIVFVLGEPLAGPGVTAARAMRSVAHIHAGLEIIDSRFADFRFTLADVVADNASSSRFVIGGRSHTPQGLDLALEACVLKVNGQVVDSATGSAVLGHPAEALALAANTLSERGIALDEGWLVLTGGMTDAVPVTAGDTVAVDFTHLGSVVLQCL